MVQTTASNLKLVRDFKSLVLKKISVDKMLFFGSRAKSVFFEDSDFDLLIVSKDFENKPFYERPVDLYFQWKNQFDVDIICYTPKEFLEKLSDPYSVAANAAKTGLIV